MILRNNISENAYKKVQYIPINNTEKDGFYLGHLDEQFKLKEYKHVILSQNMLRKSSSIAIRQKKLVLKDKIDFSSLSNVSSSKEPRGLQLIKLKPMNSEYEQKTSRVTGRNPNIKKKIVSNIEEIYPERYTQKRIQFSGKETENYTKLCLINPFDKIKRNESVKHKPFLFRNNSYLDSGVSERFMNSNIKKVISSIQKKIAGHIKPPQTLARSTQI